MSTYLVTAYYQHGSFIKKAYFGTPPEGATNSVWIYCAYYSLPLEMSFDPKTSEPLKSNMKDALICVWKYIVSTFVNSLFFSYMLHVEYTPFGITKAGRFDEEAAILDFFDPRFLGNCFFHGRKCNIIVLQVCSLISILIELAFTEWFQQGLAIGEALFGVIMAFTGYKYNPMMSSPMLLSTSPSGNLMHTQSIYVINDVLHVDVFSSHTEFWAKRWNALVSSHFKVCISCQIVILSLLPTKS